MPHTLPSITELDEFMKQVKSSVQNKRQKEMAALIVGQYEKLIEYANEVIEELNLADEDEDPDESFPDYWRRMQ